MEEIQKAAARWRCMQRWKTNGFGDMFTKLDRQSLAARHEQFSLTFFYKMLSDTIAIVKDIYLTPA